MHFHCIWFNQKYSDDIIKKIDLIINFIYFVNYITK